MKLPSGLTCPCPEPALSRGGDSLLAPLAGTGRVAWEAGTRICRAASPSSSSSPVSGVGPAGAVAAGKLPRPKRSAGFWGGEKAARGSPAASAGWRPPGTARRLFPTVPALLAGSAGSGGKPDTLPCGWGGEGPAPRLADPPRHAAGEPGRGSLQPRILWAAPSDTAAAPPDPQGCGASPIHPGEGIQSPPRHP